MSRCSVRLSTLAIAALLASPGLAADPAPARQARHTGPWNMERLGRPPAANWGPASGMVREVYYEGEPLGGKPTRVFAYYARPTEGEGPFPAMVLVHGGGGTAFPEWATLWAQRGYAALAMDLAGCGPGRKKLPDGGPGQGHDEKFAPFTDDEVGKMWTYHAVAAVVRGHSLLASLDEVDADRIGITGISWGGYLTCIVTGIDARLKVSVPVYGCGFLHHDNVWMDIFEKMEPDQRDRWVKYFDPSAYLPGVSCPILFVDGTNDFAYPLDSLQESYRAVPGRVDLRIQVKMPHSHPAGWAPKEIGLYVDSVLRDGDPLPKLGRLEIADGRASAEFEAAVPVVRGRLHYTTDTGPWKERSWQTVDAELADGKVRAALPETRPVVLFLSVTDRREAMTSTEHATLP